MTPEHALLLLAVGLFAGLIGGLTGVGGSIIMIPAMTEIFGPRQHLFQAAAMIVNFFVVVPAVIQHSRARAIQWDFVTWAIPAGFVTVLFGVAISEIPMFSGQGQLYLCGLFGLFLFYVAGYQVLQLFRSRTAASMSAPDSSHPPPRGLAVIVGGLSGLIGGLLGVGGGVVAVPIQVRWLKTPLRNAIANSAVMIIGVAVVGAITKNYALISRHGESLMESLRLAFLLAPTAILGSYVGSRWTHVLPLRAVQIAFTLLLLVSAYRMTLRGFFE